MATFEGVRVSHTWAIILNEYVREGGAIQVNSGQRTMAEQQALYDANMLNGQPRPGHALTAVPDANAPHIKQGRENHALDVDQYGEDGEQAFQSWLLRHGVHAVNNVPGEGWHIDVVDEHELIAFAHKIAAANRERSRYPTIKHKSGHNKPGHVKRLQRWLRALGFKSVKVNGKFDKKTRDALRRFKKAHKLKGGGAIVQKPTWVALERALKGRGKH